MLNRRDEMYFDFLVKIPEDTGKISLNRRNGTTYIEYTYGRRYVPENVNFQRKVPSMSNSSIVR